MNSKYSLISACFYCFVLLFMYSCTSSFQLEIEESDESVIFGLFEVGKQPFFVIQKPSIISAPIKDNRVCDAKVIVNNVASEISNKLGNCTYINKIAVLPNEVYTTQCIIGKKVINHTIKTLDTFPLPKISVSDPVIVAEVPNRNSFIYQQKFTISTKNIKTKNLFVGMYSLENSFITRATISGVSNPNNNLLLNQSFSFLNNRVFPIENNEEITVTSTYTTSKKNIKGKVVLFFICFDDTILDYVQKSRTIKNTISDPFLTPTTSFTNLNDASGFISSYSIKESVLDIDLK